VTPGDDEQVVTSPRVTLNCAAGNVPHATIGAPTAQRQLSQWQMQSVEASPAVA
jgi:hypothetical protein